MTGILDHILTEHIGQGVNAQKFDDGKIFHHLNSQDLPWAAIKTEQDILEILGLS